jgi:hypothetical protein
MARKKAIYIFDNGGATADRYTGVISKTGEIVGFNSNPFHPQGFGQFCGNVTHRMNITFGYGWRDGHTAKGLKRILNAELDNYVNEARKDSKWLGKEINVKDLSDDAKKYVEYCLSDIDYKTAE